MKKKVLPFLCGALTATVCISTALAGASYSGRISFNTNSLYLNGREIITAGESLTTEDGAEVPSSILYTDENGGGTYYVPIRPLAHALDMPATWEDDAVFWKVEGDLAVNLLSTTGDNTTYSGYIQEIAPIAPGTGHKLLSPVHHGVDNFEAELELAPSKGDTVSITVTNHGSAAIVFNLGLRQDDTTLTTPTKVPAGETVTRSFRILAQAPEGAVPYINIGNARNVYRENNFAVQVIQFDAE